MRCDAVALPPSWSCPRHDQHNEPPAPVGVGGVVVCESGQDVGVVHLEFSRELDPEPKRSDQLLHLVDIARGLEADLGRMLAWEALPASQPLLTQSTFVVSWAGSLLKSAAASLGRSACWDALPEDSLEAADVLSDATASAKQLAARLSHALRESDRASRETVWRLP